MTHVVASSNDGYMYYEPYNTEIDLDEFWGLDNFRNITFDEEEKEFYLLANKKNNLVGFFLIKFSYNDLKVNSDFLISQPTGLDIDDAGLSILRAYDPIKKTYTKELVISYKIIFINIYNVWVFDMSGPPSERSTLYIHESF